LRKQFDDLQEQKRIGGRVIIPLPPKEKGKLNGIQSEGEVKKRENKTLEIKPGKTAAKKGRKKT